MKIQIELQYHDADLELETGLSGNLIIKLTNNGRVVERIMSAIADSIDVDDLLAVLSNEQIKAIADYYREAKQ